MKMKILNTLNEVEKKLPQGTVTVTISAVITLIYLSLSQGFLFIPSDVLTSYGFTLSKPFGVITYSFLHLSPQHLVANIGLLLAVGIIAEKKIRLKEYLAVFFTSAALAGVAFHILTPTPTVLVGASSAISSILAISVFVDFKKAIPAILIFGLFISILSPALTTYTEEQLGLTENKTEEISGEYNQTESTIDKVRKDIKNLEEKISVLKTKCLEQDNETACKELDETNKTLQEALQMEKNLEKEKEKTIEELNQTMHSKIKLEQGIKREKKAKSSSLVHLIGAFTGIIYLISFRRDIIWNLTSQASQLRKYFQR